MPTVFDTDNSINTTQNQKSLSPGLGLVPGRDRHHDRQTNRQTELLELPHT